MLKNLSFLIILATFTLQCSENNIIVRPATLHDLDAITKLSHHHYEHEFKKLWEKKYTAITPSHHTTDSFVKEKMINADAVNTEYIFKQSNIENSSERFLVTELMVDNNKKITGFCRFEKRDPQTIYINFVFVDKDHRKQGMGKLLACTAMNTFEGITQCKFRALVHKESINNLYDKQGCNKVGTVALDPNTGKISTDPNAIITHYDYLYTIKK